MEEVREETRQEFVERRNNLWQLFEEQLSEKSKVYLLQLGSEDEPTALNFSKYKQRYSNLFSLMIYYIHLHMVCRCMLITQQWLDSLRGSGSCSLSRGLEKAMALTDIDTLLIVMGSRY